MEGTTMTATRRKPNNGRGTTAELIPTDYESLLVGAGLIDPMSVATVDISVGDFADHDLGEIWMLIPAFRSRGMRPDDMAVLRQELVNLGMWGPGRIDAQRVKNMLDAVPTNAPYYAERVRESATRRRILRLADIASRADDPTANVDDLLREAADIVAQDRPPTLGRPMTCAALVRDHADLRSPVVEGLLRRGETLNVIASPKVGKSWLVLQLAFSVAEGREWLGFGTRPGRVLIIDNELHPETLAHRLGRVASALAIDTTTTTMDVWPIRGHGIDTSGLPRLLSGVEPGTYSLIVLDALYRLLPPGTSENDNAAIMHVYNTLDAIAAMTQSAIAIVHHTSKGDQSGKAQTDVGSGAGSISRAADTHLTIRPHEEDGLSVMEAVTRSWQQPEPVSIRYEYPLWELSMAEPKLRKPKSGGQERQESTDDESKKRVLEVLTPGAKLTAYQVRTKTGFGPQRVARALAMLVRDGAVQSKMMRKKNSKRKQELYLVTGAQ